MKYIILIFMLWSASLMNAALPENEAHSFEANYTLAKNTQLPMSSRWKALLLAAEVAHSDQLVQLLTFSKDKDWFMRNALLVALDKMGTDIVYDKAKELLTDKALVVRSAAVDILIKLNTTEVRRLFSKELTKKYNFNGSKSLWIRSQMMSYLAEKPTLEERDFFVKYLFEKDPQMAMLSVEALQKMMQIRFAGKNQNEIINQWKSYAQQKKW